MTKRGKINPRLAKIHRSYTIEEVARLFGIHRNTVRHWIKLGLPTLDTKRPTLILGEALLQFHLGRRGRRRTKCGPGMIYCVGCRAPKRPAGGMADCVPLRGGVGDLCGLCPDCERVMHRRVSLARLAAVTADLDVRFAEAPPHLVETSDPTVNCDFKRGAVAHAKAQR